MQIGSAKEVNLSYNSRKQILTIINLVKNMNANKEKYQQLYIGNSILDISNSEIIIQHWY